MFRKLGAAVLAAGLAAGAAQAEEYIDSKAGFRVTIPEGWTRAEHTEDADLVVTSPDTETTFGFCLAHAFSVPGIEGLSQAEVDQRLAGSYTASYWRKLFEDAGLKSVAVESSGEEMQNGRTTYFAIVTYKEIRRSYKFKSVFHVLPGRAHHVTCDAYLESYAREEAAFETFLDSYVPTEGNLISKAFGPSAIPASAPAITLPANADAIAKQISAAMRRAAQRAMLPPSRDR